MNTDARRMPSRRRGAIGVAAIIVVGAASLAVLLGRDGDDEAATPPTSDDASVGVLPLLGTVGSVPERAALVVKIDGTERGRPQSGLSEADVVFEEMVEGGLTRLLAVYQSQDPDTVGPVRSARSTDLSILDELGRPLFAWSGANPTFAAAVRSADVVDVGAAAAPDAYRRSDDRSAPYNLYAAPDLLREAAADEPAATTPPDPLFTYREDDEPPGTEAAPATGFRTTGSLATDIEWTWDAERDGWVRNQEGTPLVDTTGARVRATNVVVRFTPYRDSGVRDSTGAVVPEAEAVGEGEAWLLSGGSAQPGRWNKPSADAVTIYTDTAGQPLQLAPGVTWVEVLPPGSGEIVRQ